MANVKAQGSTHHSSTSTTSNRGWLHAFDDRCAMNTDALPRTTRRPGLGLGSRTRRVAALLIPLLFCASLLGSNVQASSASRVHRCGGKPATLAGTKGPDLLVGTSSADVIWGGPGDDIIRGRGGNDIVCGSGGADAMTTALGDDVIYGGP